MKTHSCGLSAGRKEEKQGLSLGAACSVPALTLSPCDGRNLPAWAGCMPPPCRVDGLDSSTGLSLWKYSAVSKKAYGPLTI